jgi:transcriptional regulator with XRE-family HTH domain
MTDPKEVSRRINWIRQQNSLTQEQLASVLNISQPAVSKYLRERIPPADALLRIAELGRTTIEWILTGRKSYFYSVDTEAVSDSSPKYDAELNLSRKVAALPAELRQALLTLIDNLQANGEPGGQ